MEVKEKLATKLLIQDSSIARIPTDTGECFQDIAMEWFESVKGQVKESTSNKYENSLKSYVLPEFGEKELQDITYDFINERCTHLLTKGGKKGQGLSPKTVSDVLSLIRNILQYASQHGKEIPCDAHSIHVKSHMKELRILRETLI